MRSDQLNNRILSLLFICYRLTLRATTSPCQLQKQELLVDSSLMVGGAPLVATVAVSQLAAEAIHWTDSQKFGK